jgi:hypothetical protein
VYQAITVTKEAAKAKADTSSYAKPDNADSDSDTEEANPNIERKRNTSNIPLSASAFIDTKQVRQSRTAIRRDILRKLGQTSKLQATAVPVMNAALKDYRAEFWSAVFPDLFPFGTGVLPVKTNKRKAKLSKEEYASHLMSLADPRFRQHTVFPFVLFDALQRQRVFESAQISFNAKQLDDFYDCLQFLTPQAMQQIAHDLETAERNDGYASFASVKDADQREVLQRVFNTQRVLSKQLPLTDNARLGQRFEINALQIKYGQPDLFVTVNPGDFNAPLCLSYCGLDLRPALNGKTWDQLPSVKVRRLLAVQNPVACAQYSHALMEAFLSALVGFGSSDDSQLGIFGEKVVSYHFNSEEQARGTLHWHGFLWFKHRPSASDFRAALQTDSFKKRLLDWLTVTVKRTEPQLLDILKVKDRQGDSVMASVSVSSPLSTWTVPMELSTGATICLVLCIRFYLFGVDNANEEKQESKHLEVSTCMSGL